MNNLVRNQLKSIRSKLSKRKPLSGAWLLLGSPIAAEIIAQGAFDFLVLDTEHAPGDNITMYHQIRACDTAGMPLIVRLATSDPPKIVHALDAGACGIAVADVRSAADVVTLVESARYAPTGRRETHRMARAANYGLGWAHYADEMSVLPILIREESCANLNDAQKSVIEAAADVAAAAGTAAMFELTESLVVDLTAKGMTIIDLSDEERAAFRTSVQAVLDKDVDGGAIPAGLMAEVRTFISELK